MSRRDFRGEVASARPAAAWAMSIVASATLWITEQLPLWMIAIQIVAFAVSYQTRSTPPAWRRSPLWLNVGMLGITTITIRSALAGNPATISLAFFSALAQGLQLLDARPRKSEFLLVALALFQVILASNLTDSVLFPPLLVLFLASVTWTLLVHTLRMEAAEAGNPEAARHILGRDLRRTTTLATAACLCLALLLFIMLPRMKSNLIRGGVGPGMAVSGFSDRVELGDFGRIRKDDSIVLRIESLEGELPEAGDAYWRGLAFDHFDGRHWSITTPPHRAGRQAVSGIGRFGIDFDSKPAETAESSAGIDASRGRTTITHRIIREPVEAGVLFSPGENLHIEGPFQRLESDANGGLYLPGRGDERVRYTLRVRTSERSAPRLRLDRASLPTEPGRGGAREASRYLTLPELDPRIAARAAAIVEDAPNDFERARRIQEDLRQNGRYTDIPPALGEGEATPIEDFLLGGLEGHCEYFASAMVVLARSEGLPSRLVNGFAGGERNDLGGFIEVTRADAHAWVEIHFEQAGWVRFDPTPPDLRLRAGNDPSLWAQLGQIGGAIELWWFQRVVDFDSADQIGAFRSLWAKWQTNREPRSASGSAADGNPSDRDTRALWQQIKNLELLPTLLPVGLLMSVWLWRRRRPSGADPVPETYRRALKLLSRRGWRRPATQSSREFAAQVAEELANRGARAFEAITQAYLAERFGQRPPLDLSVELEALENAVEGMRLRDDTHVREA